MRKRALWMAIPLWLCTGISLAEEIDVANRVVRRESETSKWTVFNSNRPIKIQPSREEMEENKKEFSFQIAETAQEVTDSIGIPLLPQLIEGGANMAKEVYHLKKNLNKRHVHVNVSADSAEIKFKFRF